MIDLLKLRENPQEVVNAIKRKDPNFPIDSLISKDNELRKLKLEVEQLRTQKNELARQGQKGVTDELKEKAHQISSSIKDKESKLVELEKEFTDLYLHCPNILFDDVPNGNKESNKVVKTVGEKAQFDFEIKNHLELAKALGWLDFEAAAVMSASNFALYKGDGVKLVYALMLYMFNNNLKHGYFPVLPPYLVNEKSLECASNFPRFKDAVYAVKDENLFLTPTAEVNLTNMYRDHIFSQEQLPVRMTAWTSCFRREAGNYGAHERGLIRIHQFEKVELYTICNPENSAEEQDRMIACAENILKDLGLHYRISLLAAQDTSFASAKTYDIEVWMPGQNAYYEVSSVSNCTDFQARRAHIRYKMPNGKNHLAYTLNASSLALPRLMVAILETYQQSDGSIAIPEILKHVSICMN
ncbi:serine--tRNA ligase [Candidatus Dependentiae bacterium]|nr:serine--tRNA ligase [Candidatus Dependentiae bacterium]